MTTEYKHSLVIACPLSLAPDLTHLSACWSENFHLGGYEEPNMVRGTTDYVVKGTVITRDLLTRSTQPPERHPDDTDEQTDLDAAGRAFNNLMVVERPAEGEEWPEIPDDVIAAFVDVPLGKVSEVMGLEKSQPEEPTP